jgi:hypothetical protein
MFAGLEIIRENPVRCWTMLSFTVQAALVIPLLSPQSLPAALVKRRIFVPMLSGDVQLQPSQPSGQFLGAGHLTPLLVNNNPIFRFQQTPTQAMGSENPPAANLFIGSSGTEEGVRNSIAEILARPVPRPRRGRRPAPHLRCHGRKPCASGRAKLSGHGKAGWNRRHGGD